MNQDKKSWSSTVIYVLVAVLIAFFLIYKPAVGGLDVAQTENATLKTQEANSDTVILEATQATVNIAENALKTNISQIVAASKRAGIPPTAVSVTDDKVQIRYAASVNQLSRAVAFLLGSPFIDSAGQIQGSKEVFTAETQITAAGEQSVLIATLTPVPKQAAPEEPAP